MQIEPKDKTISINFEIKMIDDGDLRSVQKLYSWNIQTALRKRIDSSSIIYHGTGLPIELRSFFSVLNLLPGEKKPIKLYNIKTDEIISAYIVMEKPTANRTPRTRMFWDSKLSNQIKSLYRETKKNLDLNFIRMPNSDDTYFIFITEEENEDDNI